MARIRCYPHRTTDAEAATPPPGNLRFFPRNNRGTPYDDFASDSDSSVGHQPEWSATATKRVTRSTTKTGNTTKKSGQKRRAMMGIDEPEPGSNVAADRGHNSATRVMPALDSGFAPSPGKKGFAPPADSGTRAFRSGRLIGRGTDLKEASRPSTWTAANSSGKRDLATMTEADEPNSPADTAEPPRKITRGVPASDTIVEGEPDRLQGAVNPSQRPTARLSPPSSPPLLASNLNHDLASAASEQVRVRTSAEHLLMLASGTQQPADISASQVGTPGRSHSPSDPRTGDLLADDMPAAEAGRELSPAADSPASLTGYCTPVKLRLQLPGFSSAMLAGGSTAVSAETEVRFQ